eukprot:sb/3467751/
MTSSWEFLPNPLDGSWPDHISGAGRGNHGNHGNRVGNRVGNHGKKIIVKALTRENLELQNRIQNSATSLGENKERIKILKNKMQEQAHLLLCETGQKQALQQDNESLRRQYESLVKMKDDLQDEKDSLEHKYHSLLSTSSNANNSSLAEQITPAAATPRANKKRHRKRGGGGSGGPSGGGGHSSSAHHSGYTTSEDDQEGVLGKTTTSPAGLTVNGVSTRSISPVLPEAYSRENSYDSFDGNNVEQSGPSSPVKHYSVDDDGVIWKKGGPSNTAAVRPVMSSTMR